MPQFNDLLYLFTGQWREVLPQPRNDLLLFLLLVVASLIFARRIGRMFRPLENLWIRCARRRKAAILLCGFLAFAINAVIATCGRWPQPAMPDEFSYLLSADTFAHGRLTNPPHPMWRHFETEHVIQQPTYSSKYPPGQGLLLALGQVLFGSPIVALWLAAAAMSMAICWMLQQWLPPRWALLGGVLSATYSLCIYWSQTFWGCQLAVVGGALALGGLRLYLDARKPSTPTSRRSHGSWWLGSGMVLMILTRPFEGGALTLLMLLVASVAAVRERRIWALAPVGGLLTLLLFAQLFINLGVTHQPFLLPYQLHEKTYGVSPLLLWQSFKPEPVYRHEVMRRYHVEQEPPPYLHHRTPQVLVEVSMEKIMRLLQLLFFSPALAGAVLLLPLVLTRDRNVRLAFALTLAFVGVLLLEVWMLPHYITPILPALFLLGMQGLRRLRAWRLPRRNIGLLAMRFLVALSLLSPLSSYVALARPGGDGLVFSDPGLRKFADQRAQIQRQLEALPGRQLVIVHYRPTHDASLEWVYNRADIDNAKVVWARAMDPQQDRALAEYFARQRRQLWILDADDTPPRLQSR